jgi:hypothetical protein
MAARMPLLGTLNGVEAQMQFQRLHNFTGKNSRHAAPPWGQIGFQSDMVFDRISAVPGPKAWVKQRTT